ncbi:MAG: META domain-containing protein [Bacteroidota bacterium]
MDTRHLLPCTYRVVREVSSRTAVTFLIMSVMVGFLSCSDTGTAVQPDFTQIKNVQWRLIACDSLDGRTITLSSTDTIFLFLEETRAALGAAHGQCGNSYFGVYSLGSANAIHFDSLASSKALCPGSRYWEFFGSLQNVTSFGVDGNRLYLYVDGSRRKLVFERIS